MGISRPAPGGSLGLRLKVVLALYVLAAAIMPFGHHDLAANKRFAKRIVQFANARCLIHR